MSAHFWSSSCSWEASRQHAKTWPSPTTWWEWSAAFEDFAGFAPDSHPLCIGSMEATKRQKEYLQLQTGQESLLPPSYADFKIKSKCMPNIPTKYQQNIKLITSNHIPCPIQPSKWLPCLLKPSESCRICWTFCFLLPGTQPKPLHLEIQSSSGSRNQIWK